jgi:Do/DeqQ family serine protease
MSREPMGAGRRLTALILLVAGVSAAGLVLTSPTTDTPSAPAVDRADEGARPETAAGPPAVQGAAPTVTLPDFTVIAERTVPAVVNISSQQVVRRSNSPFANDPFFRQFFGDDVFGSRDHVQSSLGSGVIVTPDGYILTNNHVVAGNTTGMPLRQLPAVKVVLSDGREIQAEIVGVDPPTDLALLKIDATNLPTIPWGDSSQLKVAEWVLAIGNPYQLDQTVTLGIVSAVGRTNVGISDYVDFIQTDAAINPGNSGGALVNVRGELVGINTAIFSQSGGYQGIGFAVPSDMARRIAADLQEPPHQVRRGSIGYVLVAPLTTRLAQQLGAPDTNGLLVRELARAAPAYRGGLRPGDIIVSFNGTPVTTVGQLSRLIAEAPVDRSATVGVIREGQRVQLRIQVERPVQ